MLYVSDFVLLFKQKTAYEMLISDWSSDVCSSDLRLPPLHDPPSFLIGMSPHSNVKRIDLPGRAVKTALYPPPFQSAADTQYSTMRSGMQPFRYPPSEAVRAAYCCHCVKRDRKRGVSGKSVSVRVDLGGRVIIKKK